MKLKKYILGLTLLILSSTLVYSQKITDTRGYWTFSIGESYLKPTVNEYTQWFPPAVYGWPIDEPNLIIQPQGSFGNFIEIGKGFKIYKTENFKLSFDINAAANLLNIRLKYQRFDNYPNHSGEYKQYKEKILIPYINANINNTWLINNNFGFYHSLGLKYDITQGAYIEEPDRFKSFITKLNVQYAIGIEYNKKRCSMIPLIKFNILNFNNQIDYGINSMGLFYNKQYFQQIDFGIKILYHRKSK